MDKGILKIMMPKRSCKGNETGHQYWIST